MPKYKIVNGQLQQVSKHEGSKKTIPPSKRKKANKAERQNKKAGRK